MADPNFRLKKGTFIDQQVGFVDAFNSMYENINGLKGGQGVELDKSIDGAWQINADQSTDGSGGSGGSGGEGGRVDDVSVVPHDVSSLNDKIQVDYADGTSKTDDIPFEPAIDNISRQWIQGSTRLEEVLSCTYNRGANTLTIPYDFRISSLNGQGAMTYSDVSRVCLSSATDSNVKINQFPASDGIILQIGVYYV